MGRVLGFVSLLIVAAAGMYIYMGQVQAGSPKNAPSPRAAVDVTGVKNDLLVIANAERGRLASDGKYVSLDELIMGGDLSFKSASRGPYAYSSTISENGFQINAVYSGPPEPGVPQRLTIDQTMQISIQ